MAIRSVRLPRRLAQRRRLARPKTGISTREIAFFGLQAAIPLAFAVLPSLIFLLAFRDVPHSVEKLTDGTLVLIAFTMLISLSQDLQQSVRPYQRASVAKIELLLRVAALVILGVYMLMQSVAMVLVGKNYEGYYGELLPIVGKETFGYSVDQWIKGDRDIDISLLVIAATCLILSIILCARVLLVLRDHFDD